MGCQSALEEIVNADVMNVVAGDSVPPPSISDIHIRTEHSGVVWRRVRTAVF
jgi:hypothetical protein